MALPDTSAFEERLRGLIEADSLGAAEDFIRGVLEELGDAELRTALDRPPEAVAIEDWISIAADMHDARRFLPPDDADKDWQTVFVGLVNHTGTDALHAEISFGLAPEPAPPMTKPSNLTESEFAAFTDKLAAPNLLPRGSRYHAGYDRQGLRITGLDDLYAIERAVAPDDETADQRRRRAVRQTLAAGVILLRFHQTMERYAADPGLPHPMTLYAHVASVEWPMEQGIYEFGTAATRQLRPAVDRFDHAAAARIIEARERERREAYRRDTRMIICELREKQQVLALWPSWLRPRRRRLFEGFVRADLAAAQRAMAATHGIPATELSGDALYRAISAARHPDDPTAGLEPLDPLDRSALHRLAIAYARRFGGGAIRRAFAGHPHVPAGGFESVARG